MDSASDGIENPTGKLRRYRPSPSGGGHRPTGAPSRELSQRPQSPAMILVPADTSPFPCIAVWGKLLWGKQG